MNIKYKENISEGFECPCPKTGCPNHGNCEECNKYHTDSKLLPFCKREHGIFTRMFYRKNYKMVQLLKSEGKV